MKSRIPLHDIRALYDRFDAPVTALDCGQKCAPHNSSGKPFCCDICHAVPAVYRQEWDYLREHTDLWHKWRGDECAAEPVDPAELLSDTPKQMLLLACKGPALCQRAFRSVSCRQFPFFPYVSSDYRFLGLAYEWEFEQVCWVISHLEEVTDEFRQAFVRLYDELFAAWQEEFEGYAAKSEEMRRVFAGQKRRFPLLHRRGGYYLVSPASERLQRASPEKLRRFGPYLE